MATNDTLRLIFGGSNWKKLTSPYGDRIHPITGKKSFHYGSDYSCNKVNIYAIEDGIVYKRGYEAGGAGNYIYVYYPRLGKCIAYFHLTSIAVAVGKAVKEGTKVGVAGTTGSSTGVHLHIGVRDRKTWKWENSDTWLANYNASSATSGGSYAIGKTYTLQANMKVRTGPGTGYRWKKRSELTANGKKNAKSGTYAVLKKGTKVTVKAISGNWIKIPSGWVCAKQGSSVYVK